MNFDTRISKWKNIFGRLIGQGIYPYQLAFLLDTPIRRIVLSPKTLVDRLNLSDNSKVLEIGTGPGYFSIETAKRIPEGNIVLFDIQLEMLLKSKRKIERNNITNAKHVQGNAAFLPFKNSAFDNVFLVTVLGEISNRINSLIEINNVLKLGGILSITEMYGDPDLITENELELLLCQSGFVIYKKYSSSKGFTINFKKVKDL
ncbi:MAG: methyltransferase domain-containing protein [Bacteroidetes bacterium]|nr:methyltransferase domain-containing protein [Bacteroidota bacterium]